MDKALKQRLIGAAVLIAIAVIFLPMLLKGPAPISGAADVSLDVPVAPKDGFETRELSLGAPGAVPAGGVAGMAEPTPATTAPDTVISSPAVAAGDYAVNFGYYGTSADADRMVAALGQTQLQAYAEPATLSGRNAWRVRLGPYATRAEAEAARLRALHVTDKVKASVVALNADAATPAIPASTAATAVASPPVTTKPLPPAPTAVATAPAPKPAVVEAPRKPPVTSKPAETKPAAVAAAPKPVEKPAETAPKPAPKPAASSVGFAVQLGAFADASAATALRDKARAAGLSAFTETINTPDGKRTRVRVGPVADRADADKLRAQAQSKLGIAGIVRPHP